MNRILTVALAATAFAATPALAQDTAATFTGPRIGGNLGIADEDLFGTEDFTYGAEVGYDMAAGGAILGLSAEIQASDDIDRELALTARAGARVGNHGLLYVTGGYSNVRAYGINLDGFRLGVGAEVGLGTKGFVKFEQRYGNYEYGLELYQTVLGAGIRF